MRVSRTRFSKRRSKRKTEFPIVAVVQKKRKGNYLKSTPFGVLRNNFANLKSSSSSSSSSVANNLTLSESSPSSKSTTNTRVKENQSSNPPKITSFRPQKKSRATIDYKNVILLRNLITAEGKILPRRISKLTAKQQRYVQKAIKSARIMGLIPFINKSRPF